MRGEGGRRGGQGVESGGGNATGRERALGAAADAKGESNKRLRRLKGKERALGAAADATGESNKRLRRLKEKGRCSRKMKEEELEMDSAEIATGDGSEDGEE